MEELRVEDIEPKPYLLFTITDESGQVARRLKTPAKPGVRRITWDLRYPSPMSVRLTGEPQSPFRRRGRMGMLVMPGKYSVTLAKYANGEVTPLAGPQTFQVIPLKNTMLPAKDRKAMVEFQAKVSELARVVRGTGNAALGIDERIKIIKKALHLTPKASPQLMKQAENIENQLREILLALNGDSSISKRNENQPPSISSRISRLMYGYMRSTAEPTQTMKDQYRITGEELEPQLEKLRQLVEKDLNKLEAEMEAADAPWTPGRIPKWKK
jgi:hypothetical protein